MHSCPFRVLVKMKPEIVSNIQIVNNGFTLDIILMPVQEFYTKNLLPLIISMGQVDMKQLTAQIFMKTFV